MPNVNDLKKYHNKDSFRSGDIVEFVSGGEITEIDFSKEKNGSNVKEVLQLDVSINGADPKAWTINSTSMKSLSAAWGNITEKWVGKKAKVEFMKMQAFGKISDVLFLTPLQDNGKAWDE